MPVPAVTDRLLTIDGAADMLNTKPQFPRRLIAERRIRFVREGRHVRIPESAVRELIAAGTVGPLTSRYTRRRAASWPVKARDISALSAGETRAAIRPVTGDRMASSSHWSEGLRLTVDRSRNPRQGRALPYVS
jgi:excisionase family DNA binding protein